MQGYVTNIEKAVEENTDFRRVLYTAKNIQLVLMNLKPGEDIGEETHHLDQFIRIESGAGKAVLNGAETALANGSVVLIPAGMRHNIANTSATEPLKLYSLYAPPEHKDRTVHATKANAVMHEEHFDGQTTEQ